MRLLLFQVVAIFLLTGCDPDGPVDPDYEYFVRFDDAGETISLEGVGAVFSPYRTSNFIWGFDWGYAGMSLKKKGDGPWDLTNISINLPVDSSRLNLIEIGEAYSIDSLLGFDGPLTIHYRRSTTTHGTDISQFGATDFNQINSIEHIGNKHYSTIESVVVSDFIITGMFRLRVLNDITQEWRVLDNGTYKLKVSIITQ